MFEGEQNKSLRNGAFAVLILLSLFLGAKVIAEVMGYRFIGVQPTLNVITVEGEGEVVAIPDVAEFTFAVVEKDKTVAVAQKAATDKTNAIMAYLREAGIEEKDVKTIGYNVSPQYDWIQEVCTATRCGPGKSVLNGYEVRQTIQVKVRDTAKAGDLLTGIGEKGASELSGLTFSIDDDEALRSEARAEAIEKATAKAEALADGLDVKLVRVISFNESPEYMPYYGYGMGGVMYDKAMSSVPQAAPEIPTGENKIISRVTVTYEIR